MKIFNGSLHGHRRWASAGAVLPGTMANPAARYLRGLEAKPTSSSTSCARTSSIATSTPRGGSSSPASAAAAGRGGGEEHEPVQDDAEQQVRRRPHGLRLTADERAYVRECMFPGDAELARRLCHGNNASGLP